MNHYKFDPAFLIPFDELHDLVQKARDRSPKAADACVRRFCERHRVPLYGIGNARFALLRDVEKAMLAEGGSQQEL
jgi:hypothetical protein